MKNFFYLTGLLLITSGVIRAQCTKFTTIASGPVADHSFGIQVDGTLWAWGNNSSGQLGDATTIDKNTATKIGTEANWARVSAGSRHSLGIKSDGTLWAWGNNEYGQLGDGTNNDKNVPIQIGAATNWLIVKAGAFHSIGIKSDGSLWAWGINSNGELGIGNNTSQNAPVQIIGASDWTSISVGFSHSLGIRSDGSLWAWGDNLYGQLGDGNNVDRNRPVQIATGSIWTNVSGGGYHTLGIKSNGTLWTWGKNDEGQLGNGNYDDKNVPIMVSNANTYAVISAGMYHSAALRRLGAHPEMLRWGANDYREFGDGSGTNYPLPREVSYGSNWVSITAGRSHSFGLTNDGQAWAWGNNRFGQLGNSSNTSVDAPTRSGCSIGPWATVHVSPGHTIATKSDGTAWWWGEYNTGWQGFYGDTKIYPTQIGTQPDWKSVSSGVRHFLLLKKNGTIWAWGSNAYGQVGNGKLDVYNYAPELSPIQIGTDTNWASISASSDFSMAIKTNGTLWAWGDNSKGQLGIGSLTTSIVPVQVGFDNDWAEVYAGNDFVVAIKKNGTLWTWGTNALGQLGDGSNTPRTSPVQIGSDTDWASAVARNHAIARKMNGTLWAWGDNRSGQLGDGSKKNRNSPVKIGSDNDWVSFGAGLWNTMAVKSDGTLWKWGRDSVDWSRPSAEPLIFTLTPTKQNLGTNWASIILGDYSFLGIKTNGSLWAWGSGDMTFGNGSQTPQQTPIPAATFTLPAPTKLARENSTATMQQGQYNMFENNSSLIASVISETGASNPISGPVTTRVWVEAVQPEQYVLRHFEIAPANNANNATGWVTLYFTESDFYYFNEAANTADLPSGPYDNVGISRIRIEKRGGTSSDNTGRPGSYPGPPVTFRPTSIVWNESARWWEIGFKTTGFSGFFLKTTEDALPVHLVSFKAQEFENSAVLKWETSTETAASHFDVERSVDAIRFEKIGEVPAAGYSDRLQAYTFTDNRFGELSGEIYYRLRMVDADGSFTISRIQPLTRDLLAKAYPNPVKKGTTLTVEVGKAISELSIRDISGTRVPVRIQTRTDKRVELSLVGLPQGIYILQINTGDSLVNRKFVIE